MKTSIFAMRVIFPFLMVLVFFGSCVSMGLFKETRRDVGEIGRVYQMDIASDRERDGSYSSSAQLLFFEYEEENQQNMFGLSFSITVNPVLRPDLQRHERLLSGSVDITSLIGDKRGNVQVNLESSDLPTRRRVGNVIIETFGVTFDEDVFQQIFSGNEELEFFLWANANKTAGYGDLMLDLRKQRVRRNISQFFEKHRRKS
jgi:hypothetical protein